MKNVKEQIIHSLRVATKVIVGKIKVEKKGDRTLTTRYGSLASHTL